MDLEAHGGVEARVVAGRHLREVQGGAVRRARGEAVRDGDLRGVVGAARGLADPDRCGDDDVAVRLGGAHEEPVALGDCLVAGERQFTTADVGEGVGHFAAVGDELDLGEGVPLVGVLELDVEVDLGGVGGQDRAHELVVGAEGELDVLILGAVGAAVLHGGVQALERVLLGPHATDRLVAADPGGGVLVAVPDRRDVPAGVEGEDVLVELRGALDLDQFHRLVDCTIEAVEPEEVALAGGARVVELADRIGVLLDPREEGVHVVLHVAGAEAVAEAVHGALLGRPRSGLPVRVEDVDVTGAVVPGVLDRGDGDEFVLRVVERERLLVDLAPLLGVGVAPVLEEVVAVAQVPHHVVLGDREEVCLRGGVDVLEGVDGQLHPVAHRRV